VINLGQAGQNHTTIETTRTQNANHNLRVGLSGFTNELSVQLRKRIKANLGNKLLDSSTLIC
jgi:hypothetical protein